MSAHTKGPWRVGENCGGVTIKVGSKLANGATVLQAKTSRHEGESIVLAFTGEESVQPFVVWRVRNSDLVAVSGDYSSDLTEAAEAFAERK